MLGAQIDQKNLSSYHAVFPAAVTARGTDSPPSYSWTEKVYNPAAAAYVDPDPAGRSGYCGSSGAAGYRPAYEINGLSIDTTSGPIVWMRFRADADGEEVYEFDGAGMNQSPPATNLDVQEVTASGGVVVDAPNTGTLQFDDSTGLTVTRPSAGTARVSASGVNNLDVQEVSSSGGVVVDVKPTKILQFDDSTGLTVSQPVAGTARVKGTLLDVQQLSTSGGIYIDVNPTKILQFDSMFTVTSPAAGTAKVSLPAGNISLASGQVITSGTTSVTGGVWTAVPGLSIVLPAPGTYVIQADLLTTYNPNGATTNQFFQARLQDATNNVTLLSVVLADYLNPTGGPYNCYATLQWIYTTTVPNVTVEVDLSNSLPSATIRASSTMSYIALFANVSGGGGGGGGGGTVTSVNASGGSTGMTFSGGPITTSGTLTMGGTLNAASGGTGINGSTAANGTLLIGNGSGYSLATLTAGSGITITNGAGSITIAGSGPTSVVGADSVSVTTASGTATVQLVGDSATPGNSMLYGTNSTGVRGWYAQPAGGGSGTVTSVNASGGSTGLSFSGGPITTSGTLTMGGTLVVGSGGTGASTLTPYAVLCGGTAPTAAVQSVASTGTSGQVLTSNGASALPSFQNPVDSTPTGTILPFAGLTGAPAGYLDCNGLAVSRTTYSALWSALSTSLAGSTTSGSTTITGLASTDNLGVGYQVTGSGIPSGATIATIASGTSITLSAAATATASGVSLTFTAWGAGDGSTTFNLPDLQGRIPLGRGSGAGLTARTLAQTGGEETHALNTTEMPAHNHNVKAATGGTGTVYSYYATNTTVAANYLTDDTGGGAAHNNMQPFAVVRYVIKT